MTDKDLAGQAEDRLKGYLCRCTTFMPETSFYLEGTDADVCKQMLHFIVNDCACERVPLSDMRAMRYDEAKATNGKER